MSDDWHYVHQLAVLAGFKLIVLANRIGCEDEFLLKLHDDLAEGRAAAIARLRAIVALEHQLATEPTTKVLLPCSFMAKRNALPVSGSRCSMISKSTSTLTNTV